MAISGPATLASRLVPIQSKAAPMQNVYVRMVISYDVPQFPGIPFGAVFEFVDTGPDFPATQRITAAYERLLNVDVQIIHSDLPETGYRPSTHAPDTLSLH